jgi:hypothetical protein
VGGAGEVTLFFLTSVLWSAFAVVTAFFFLLMDDALFVADGGRDAILLCALVFIDVKSKIVSSLF